MANAILAMPAIGGYRVELTQDQIRLIAEEVIKLMQEREWEEVKEGLAREMGLLNG